MKTLTFGKPHVGIRDMGYMNKEKFFFWCPWPVWYSKKGTAYYISRSLFKTEKAAVTALEKYLETVNCT